LREVCKPGGGGGVEDQKSNLRRPTRKSVDKREQGIAVGQNQENPFFADSWVDTGGEGKGGGGNGGNYCFLFRGGGGKTYAIASTKIWALGGVGGRFRS